MERHILIVDTADGVLQRLAVDLIGRGFDVHYAAALDEAQLLAGEMEGRVNAVLFTCSEGLPPVQELAARFGVEPKQLIPFGERPASRMVAAFAHHGVRWHLWGDPADEAIRFVISGVLFEHDPFELRYHLRVPTRLPATLVVDGQKSETTIRDLSLGGACLVGGAIPPEGEKAELCLALDDESVTLPVRTAWLAPGGDDDVSIGGVAFVEVAPEAGDAIDALRRSVITRHRIVRPD